MIQKRNLVSTPLRNTLRNFWRNAEGNSRRKPSELSCENSKVKPRMIREKKSGEFPDRNSA